jgi:DNA primase
MALSPQWLDELRSRITLSSVIQRTTRLQKAGREFKACCPFHNEKTPSFTVNDEKGFYHCFGCGAHGDAIRWMTDQRGLQFMDAVKELAVEAGMDVPAPDPRAAERKEKRDTLVDVMAAAQQWFVENLRGPEGARAREYLKSRGFDARTVERFGFGFAPENRQALKEGLSRFPEEMLVEAGLRISVDGKEPYDRFRGRLMLPIEDARGRVIAFGGRILDGASKDAPKYLNSPDTPLFDKGRTLYNLHRAAPAARQSGRMIVVEGYMDVIALSAAGIEECVAPLGTALTEQQIELLWRHVESPILCFDGDAAGQRAAMRAVTRALPQLRPSHSLRIVRLPAGLDPDDLVRRDGKGAMEKLLGETRSLVETLWLNERDAASLATPEDKAGLKARLMEHVDAIKDSDIRALYRRELLKQFSALAFPPRDWTKQSNVYSITDAKRWARTQRGGRSFKSQVLGFVPRPDPDLIAKHTDQSRRKEHLQRRLGAAICAGLLRFPEFSLLYAETLVCVPNVDPRLGIIVEATFEFDRLEQQQLESILTENGFSLPEPSEWDKLRFPFTWPPADDDSAAHGLEEAIKLYAGKPQFEALLHEATEKLTHDFSDENYREQQRILKRAMELELECSTLGRAA